MPKVAAPTPKTLKPFSNNGVILNWREGEEQATSDCCFCGKESKFSIEVATSKYRCWSCQASGNATEFVRHLHEMSVNAMREDDYEELVADRKLMSRQTLIAWGAAVSVMTREWLLPTYNAEGNLQNVHRFKELGGKRTLQATGGLNLHMFGVPLLSKKHDEVWILESWNALAMWETLGIAGDKSTGVVGVPGCNVFQESWCSLFAGKQVVIAFDNDHPRKNDKTDDVILPAGFEGCKRTAQMLAASPTPPASISYLAWGSEGYDPELKSGWDVRDALTESSSSTVRTKALSDLRAKVVPIPEEWTADVQSRTQSATGHQKLTPSLCTSWTPLRNAFRQALRVRQEMEDALLTMLAVAASTSQVGDQIFLQLVGDPGSSKTKMCDAMLVSPRCFPLEDFNSFYSGYKNKDGDSFSLIDRINHLTLITPEADVIMSSSNFDTIMSQQRRIFDGGGGKTFGNDNEDKRYTGLRTPWIMAGTAAMLDKNQSRLGDRFIRFRINQPNEIEKRSILRSVGYSALRSVLQTSNGDPTTSIEESIRTFYQLTGGYVNYLRDNMERLVGQIIMEEDKLIEDCADYGEFAALFRARPAPPKKDGGETHDIKELPTRLTSQFVRLSCCLSVAMIGREGDPPVIGPDVMRIVNKVAVDTAAGRVLELGGILIKEEVIGGVKVGGQEGRYRNDIANRLRIGEDHCKSLLQFLRIIGLAMPFTTTTNSNQRWKLTDRAEFLYKKAMAT